MRIYLKQKKEGFSKENPTLWVNSALFYIDEAGIKQDTRQILSRLAITCSNDTYRNRITIGPFYFQIKNDKQDTDETYVFLKKLPDLARAEDNSCIRLIIKIKNNATVNGNALSAYEKGCGLYRPVPCYAEISLYKKTIQIIKAAYKNLQIFIKNSNYNIKRI